MSLIIMPRLTEMMTKRQNIIDEHLKKANEMKEKADLALKKYEEALEKANEIARINSEKTISELNDFISKKQVSLQKDLDKQIKKADEEFEKSKQKAIDEASEISKTLAKDVVAKLGIK